MSRTRFRISNRREREIQDGWDRFIADWAKHIAADNRITKPLDLKNRLAASVFEIGEALKTSTDTPAKRWPWPHAVNHLRPLLNHPKNDQFDSMDDAQRSLIAALSGATALGSKHLDKAYMKIAEDMERSVETRVAKALKQKPKREELESIIRQAIHDVINNYGGVAGSGHSSDDFDSLDDGSPKIPNFHWEEQRPFQEDTGPGKGWVLRKNRLGKWKSHPLNKDSVPLTDKLETRYGRIPGKGYVPAPRMRIHRNTDPGHSSDDLDRHGNSYTTLDFEKISNPMDPWTKSGFDQLTQSLGLIAVKGKPFYFKLPGGGEAHITPGWLTPENIELIKKLKPAPHTKDSRSYDPRSSRSPDPRSSQPQAPYLPRTHDPRSSRTHDTRSSNTHDPRNSHTHDSRTSKSITPRLRLMHDPVSSVPYWQKSSFNHQKDKTAERDIPQYASMDHPEKTGVRDYTAVPLDTALADFGESQWDHIQRGQDFLRSGANKSRRKDWSSPNKRLRRVAMPADVAKFSFFA